MAIEAGLLRDRIMLSRLNTTTKQYELIDDVPTIWAVAEDQGDGNIRFRIRYRTDLQAMADLTRSMRANYNGAEYDLIGIVEADRRTETHLLASRRVVKDVNDLQSGSKGMITWP